MNIFSFGLAPSESLSKPPWRLSVLGVSQNPCIHLTH